MGRGTGLWQNWMGMHICSQLRFVGSTLSKLRPQESGTGTKRRGIESSACAGVVWGRGVGKQKKKGRVQAKREGPRRKNARVIGALRLAPSKKEEQPNTPRQSWRPTAAASPAGTLPQRTVFTDDEEPLLRLR